MQLFGLLNRMFYKKKSVKHMLQNTKKEISEKKKEKQKGGQEASLMNLKIIHKKIF